MATGDSDDILGRVKAVIPFRWFAYVAPLCDAVLGGLSDLGAWCYSFYQYAVQQSRIATSTGPFLDLIAYDFFGRLLLRNGSTDSVFLTKIKALLFQERVTRAGMVGVITALVGTPPVIFEPWNPADAGAWDMGAIAWQGPSAESQPGGGWDVAAGWDTNASGFDITPSSSEGSGGAGGWGDTALPAQFLITIKRPGLQGIPNISGFDSGGGGWDQGSIEWTDPDMVAGPVTDQDIYDAINATRPTGTIGWTQLD
jgi:hypothetical protein